MTLEKMEEEVQAYRHVDNSELLITKAPDFLGGLVDPGISTLPPKDVEKENKNHAKAEINWILFVIIGVAVLLCAPCFLVLIWRVGKFCCLSCKN